MTVLDFGIDALFDEPWYTGSASATAADVPGVYQVAIDGHGYVIDPEQYSRVTVPLRRESTDESVEPGEQTLNTGGAWRRSQDNWFLGAGQEYLDNRFAFVSVYTHSGEDPSVRTRFWRSKGVNPWGEGTLSLLPEYSLGQAVDATSHPVIMRSVGIYVFVAEFTSSNQVLRQLDNDLSVNNLINAPGGGTTWPAIKSMSTDGDNLYIACGANGTAILTAGSSTASWLRPSAPTPTVAQVSGATPGTTTYTYYIVATDANGFKSLPSTAGTLTTGNASLASPNQNLITWTAVPGAVSYDILRGDTAHYVALGITATSYTDASNSTTSYTTPTATTQNFQTDFVLYANSFLLGGSGPQLCSIGANGTTTEVMTHFNSNYHWLCGSGAPGNVYVSGSGSGKSEIYGIQLSTTTFTLASPYVAGDVTAGEVVNDLLYYQGLVVLGTSLGIRTSQASGTNGFLTMGPVISDLGAVQCLAVYGGFVYFGVSNFAENDGVWQGTTTTSGLGRLSLSVFSSALIPAYATDVMSTVGGTTTGIAMIGGVPFFGISGSGVWTPSGNLVSQGWMEAGWVRYGTIEKKILVNTDVRHDPLVGTVQIEVVPFSGSSSVTSYSNQPGSTGPPYQSAGNIQSEAFMPIIILSRSGTAPATGPTVRRWTMRAQVVALRQDQIVVPIIWADDVLSPVGDGTKLFQDLESEWIFLKDLETSGQPFIYQEGALSYTCFIDQIELKPYKWNDQKGMLEGLLSVKLLTVQ